MMITWRCCAAVWRLHKAALVLYTCVAVYLMSWTYPRTSYFTYTSTPVNNFDYETLLNPSHLCSIENKPSLLILVISTVENLQKREAIRDTWGSISRQTKTASVAVIFLFGDPHDDMANRQIKEEAYQSGDVLQVGVSEEYGLNVTRKILAGFNWTLEHCPSVRHIMKADDDVFIDVPAVIRRLESSLCGATLCGHKVFVSVTKRFGKYALSFKEYPYFFLPPYLFGYFYVMPRQVVVKLLSAARFRSLIRMEDIYITGVLPRVAGLSTTAYRSFISDKDYSVDLCDFVTSRRDVNIGVSPEQMYLVWDTYMHPSLCDPAGQRLGRFQR